MQKWKIRFRQPRSAVAGKTVLSLLTLLAATWAGSTASAGVFITEFNSATGSGSQNFEFVEFTNTGNTPQSMVGWSEDDSGATPNKSGHSLSGYGTLAPHESAIFTEADPNNFRIFWWGSVAAAPAGLKIIGPYTNDNLSGSTDSVTLFNAALSLVDRIDYPGTPVAGSGSGVSRNPTSDTFLGLLGPSKNSNWVDSAIGDGFGSFRAAGFNALIGNPGFYPYTPVPEPGTLTLGALGVGLLGLSLLRKRRGKLRGQ